ncbi:acyltransferase family protein [Prevotella sp. E13-17]|uniref:acyltransferase family protein n=1 Tax=Prevotella sp. E13-17 TaxID=2913616 RepID=UPI001EDB9800|nr:acyltransferase family protein [Prevotella sp. E13-17]UKK51722.1 acyltransferase family protein [Prevotella sp. E13-17]
MIKNWIDWMKVIGMFTIIWGHCFPVLFSDFLYAFSVPLFFFISGYLSRYEPDKGVFWKKIFQRLLVPYLILSVLKAAPHLFSEDAPWSLLAIMTGFHTLHDVMGCGKLWFVYTLIIIKVITQLTRYSRNSRYVLLVVSLVVGMVCQSYYPDGMSWAVANTFLSLPWFLLGYEYKCLQWDTKLTDALQEKSVWLKGMLTLLLMISLYGVSMVNGRVRMYEAGYGENIFLFLLGGAIGILAIRIISEMLGRYRSTALSLLSIGTIVILAYHQDINHSILKLIRQQEWTPLLEDAATFACSLVTLLVFIPINYVVSHYLPFIIGNRKQTLNQ